MSLNEKNALKWAEDVNSDFAVIRVVSLFSGTIEQNTIEQNTIESLYCHRTSAMKLRELLVI